MIIKYKDIFSQEEIFKTIQKIESQFQFKEVVSIVFFEDVKFVNPLFLILLLTTYEKYKDKVLAIDLIDLDSNDHDNRQHIINRFLTQYMDLEYFYKRTKARKDKTTKSNEEREALYETSDLLINEARDKVSTGHIFYYNSKEYKNTQSVSMDQDKKYNMQPILKITNVSKTELGTLHNPLDETDRRKLLYKKLIDIDSKDYKKVLTEVVETLLMQLKIGKTLTEPVSNIFFEIIDNIKKHTKSNDKLADGHICFYHDSFHRNIELIINDNYENGFLKKYLFVLEEEIKELKVDLGKAGKSIDETIYEEYSIDIELLKNNDIESDKIVLEKLFDITTTFNIHQIPRIIMHFGLPTLIQLVGKLNGTLRVYLHRDERYYQIICENGKVDINYLGKNGVKGTCIYVSFNDEIEYKTITASVPLSVKNSDYKKIFKRAEVIQNKIARFRPANEDAKSYDGRPRHFSFKKYKHSDIGKRSEALNRTISDFIREVFRYAYIHNTKDILVIDFPIDEYENYLFLLIKILYPDSQKDEASGNSGVLNIVFFDDTLMKAFFIGGRNRKEFCEISSLISKKYAFKDIAILENMCTDINGSDLKMDSALFDEEIGFLPFELFNLEDLTGSRILLKDIIKQNLKKNRINDIHLDTQRGYHIDGFYQFNNLFSSTLWLNRIAFSLAIEIQNLKCEKPLLFIGTDKHSSLIISLAKSFLSSKEAYFILNDFSHNSLEKLDSFCHRYDSIKYTYIIISPVVFTGNKIMEKIISKLNTNYHWFNTIRLNTKMSKKLDIKSYLEIELMEDSIHEVSKDSLCSVCTGKIDKPLYRIDLNDHFMIEDFYLDNYHQKEIKSFQQDISKVEWLDSIYATHVKRNNNHYTYYTKTINFFNQNSKLIEKSFLKEVREKTSRIQANKEIIIFSPVHNTNNNFVSTVDRVVFDNDATIYQFDKSKGEENFYLLNNIQVSSENSLIYFVDDEISSGNTFSYFSSLLFMKFPTRSFDGVIVMIDRMSAADEKTINNSLNFKRPKLDYANIHSFVKLEMKPIKTGSKDCYLCVRRDDYIKQLVHTVLDMNRFQAVERIVKLKLKDYHDIDYEQSSDYEKMIKTYIKMYAVDYVYSNYNMLINQLNKIDVVYRKFEDNFTIKVYGILVDIFQNKFDFYDLAIIEKIAKEESKIALIKALSFPKLVYFKTIRDTVTRIVTMRIKEECKNFINIEPFFHENEVTRLNKLYNVPKAILKYKKSTNTDYINFLYKTAGYLNITYVLNSENINFFFNLTQQVKHNKTMQYDHSLLHAYPLAAQMVSSYSIDRSKYFSEELLKFSTDKEETTFSSFSMIHALFLENNYTVKPKSFKKSMLDILEIESSIDKKIKIFQEQINALFLKDKKSGNAQIKNIFINENLNMKYKDYRHYLQSSQLRDVINDFNVINEQNQVEREVLELYAGAVTDSSFKNKITLKPISTESLEFNNTWSNRLCETSSEYLTVIRLIDIQIDKVQEITDVNVVNNNKLMWFRPLGCIVLSYKKENDHYLPYQRHLIHSRILLSIQNEIVEFFKEELSYETFQETIKNNSYKKMYNSFLHNEADMVDLHNEIRKAWEKCEQHIVDGPKKDELKKHYEVLDDYAYGVAKIGRIGQLKMEDTGKVVKPENVYELIKDEKERIGNFVDMAIEKKFSKTKIDLLINDNCKKFQIKLSPTIFLTILYELIFNASKYGNLGTCKVEIYQKGSTLYIKNKKGNVRTNGFEIAVSYIKEFFSKMNYHFQDSESTNEYYIITIKEKM